MHNRSVLKAYELQKQRDTSVQLLSVKNSNLTCSHTLETKVFFFLLAYNVYFNLACSSFFECQMWLKGDTDITLSSDRRVDVTICAVQLVEICLKAFICISCLLNS